MTWQEALEKLLRAYGAYYDVNRLTPAAPFAAEAVFHSHEEQYFLVKSARLAESESHEYVFFAGEERLSAAGLTALSERAWEEGLSRVRPHKDHQSSDVALILLADAVDEDAMNLVKKIRHYKSYRWTLQGWSHFRLFAVETSTGRMAWNRQGQSLKKVIQGNIGSP